MVDGKELPRITVAILSIGGEVPWENRQGQWSLLYGASGGPISGVRTGLARPKKTTVPLAPKRVDRAGSGTSFMPSSGRSQLFATHTLPAGSMATSVMIFCPPM